MSGTCQYGGDGHCDGENNNQACNYDDGDCCLEWTNCDYCEENSCFCHETNLANCLDLEQCEEGWLGDHQCDASNNIEECSYDGGDCCQDETNCVDCEGSTCMCHETGLSHCLSIGNHGSELSLVKQKQKLPFS